MTWFIVDDDVIEFAKRQGIALPGSRRVEASMCCWRGDHHECSGGGCPCDCHLFAWAARR